MQVLQEVNSGSSAEPTVQLSTDAHVVPSASPATVDQPSTSTKHPTSAPGFQAADGRRGVLFHLLGTIVPIPVAAVALVVGGDRLALIAFCTGAGLHALSNAVLLSMTRKPALYQSRAADVVRLVATAALQPSFYYFGPLSAAVIIPMQLILYTSLGRVRWLAFATTIICVASQFLLGLGVITGWTHDVGILAPTNPSLRQMIVAEACLFGFLVSGYLLGRWARGNAASAFNELESAMRIIGDREQALAEVAAEAARQMRINEGRWTDHTLGRWRVGLVLGRGAMGEVYEALGPNDEPAALKMLSAASASSRDIVERFQREMQLAAQLESPHIVKVLELSTPSSPAQFIAMERLYGVDLATRLREENRIPIDELAMMLDQVARGLEVAHHAGVVHRDLKPHNLFHHQRSVWKILDFGVSKMAGSEGTLTGAGIVGTPQYMAPEQASGGDVTQAADIYALGAIAYRCLTGRTLFKGGDLAELVYQVVHGSPVRPSTLGRVPNALEDVLAVALAKDPRKRFPSALAFARAVASTRRGESVDIDIPDHAWL